MRSAWLLGAALCVAVHLHGQCAQAYVKRYSKDTEEVAASSEEDASHPSMSPAVPPVNPAPAREGGRAREMTSYERSHETESPEEEEDRSASVSGTGTGTSVESRQNSDEEETVSFPKAATLCPARPEEMAAIEQECAKEYQQWKEQKARKDATTTTSSTFPPPPVELVEVVEMEPPTIPTKADGAPKKADMAMTTTPGSGEEASTTDATTEASPPSPTTTATVTVTSSEEDATVTVETTEAAVTTEEAATPAGDVTTPETPAVGGSKRRRSVKRKRSCYPATCILKKLKLLDSLGQLNSKQIQKFAVNMTVTGSTNLEQKAVECVKEINDAMVDSSADIGKKVGCVAYKVITCLNKGLACPIIKVPHN